MKSLTEMKGRGFSPSFSFKANYHHILNKQSWNQTYIEKRKPLKEVHYESISFIINDLIKVKVYLSVY